MKCLVLANIRCRELCVWATNRELKINEVPLFSFPFLGIVFVSLCSLCINGLIGMLFCDGITPQRHDHKDMR